MTMKLTSKPHMLPIDDANFRAFINSVDAKFHDALTAPGGLPDYPTFVDRLFKQTPMLAPQRVLDMIVACTNDEGLDVQALVKLLQQANDSPEGSMLHAAVGCAGEGGELLDWVKKVAVYGKPWMQTSDEGQSTLAHIIEEMGDFRFYYQKILNMLDMTDEDIRRHNMVKLLKRYASGTYSDAAALARADKAEAVAAPEVQRPARQFFGQKP